MSGRACFFRKRYNKIIFILKTNLRYLFLLLWDVLLKENRLQPKVYSLQPSFAMVPKSICVRIVTSETLRNASLGELYREPASLQPESISCGIYSGWAQYNGFAGYLAGTPGFIYPVLRDI